jgi:hypothetical protein
MAALPIGYSIGPKTGIGFGKHDAQIQLLGATHGALMIVEHRLECGLLG